MSAGPDPSRDRPSGAPGASHLLALFGLLVVVGGLWLLPVAPGLGSRPEPPEPGAEVAALERWVDPEQARLVETPPWADPRWLGRVRALIAAEPPFALGSGPAALERLRAALTGLSFVERVTHLEASEEGGLAVALLLRKPVACLPVLGEFALVDEDGVVLEGRWPLPPRLGRAYLPVLGPLDDPLFARARAGDWLVEPEHLDALDVALSLAENMAEAERVALGRIVIDARAARRATPAEPGVRLELEGGRVALYGRAPSTDEPGELAAEAKWRGLVRAFDWFARDPSANDWRLVDLRWDRPDLALDAADGLVARVAPGERGSGAEAQRVARGRGGAGPRVR